MNYFTTLSFNTFFLAMFFLSQLTAKKIISKNIKSHVNQKEKNALKLYLIKKITDRYTPLDKRLFLLKKRYSSGKKGSKNDAFSTLSISALIALLTISFSTKSAGNIYPAWFEQEYHYVIVDQDIRDILYEFGRNISMPIIISDDIDGRIRGRVNAETAGEFINLISEQSGLTWYQHGQSIYIDTLQTMTDRNIDVASIPSTEIEDLLPSLLIGRPLFAELSGNEISISGPQNWVENVIRRVRALESPPSALPPAESVKVFRGRSRERISPDEY